MRVGHTRILKELRDSDALAAHWAQLVPEDETPTTDALKRIFQLDSYVEGDHGGLLKEEAPPEEEEPRAWDIWDLVARLDKTITRENAIGGAGPPGVKKIAAAVAYTLKHTPRLIFTLTEADFIRAAHPKLGQAVTCPRSIPPELRSTAVCYTCQNSGQWFGQILRAQTDAKRRELAPGNYLRKYVLVERGVIACWAWISLLLRVACGHASGIFGDGSPLHSGTRGLSMNGLVASLWLSYRCRALYPGARVGKCYGNLGRHNHIYGLSCLSGVVCPLLDCRRRKGEIGRRGSALKTAVVYGRKPSHSRQRARDISFRGR